MAECVTGSFIKDDKTVRRFPTITMSPFLKIDFVELTALDCIGGF